MSVISSSAAKAPPRRLRLRRVGRALGRAWRLGRKAARAVHRRYKAAPRPLRIAALAVAVLALLPLANLAYQVARKPTEFFAPMSGAFAKYPAATWRSYAPLFRKYSTATIRPALLAALAQVESAGNPLAQTYWRWQFSLNPFDIYAPASSAVGMFQMTYPAFLDARNDCIRDHEAVTHCRPDDYYSRLVPSDSVQLAAAYLDRGVAAVLGQLHRRASPPQVQNLATIIHLCGPSVGVAYARRDFRLRRGEYCGDHDAALYLAKVASMARAFRRLARR